MIHLHHLRDRGIQGAFHKLHLHCFLHHRTRAAEQPGSSVAGAACARLVRQAIDVADALAIQYAQTQGCQESGTIREVNQTDQGREEHQTWQKCHEVDLWRAGCVCPSDRQTEAAAAENAFVRIARKSIEETEGKVIHGEWSLLQLRVLNLREWVGEMPPIDPSSNNN